MVVATTAGLAMTTKSIHPRLRQALRRWERWRLLHWAWRQLPMAGLLLGVLALTLAMVGPNLADAGVSVPWLLALLPALLLAYPSWRWWRWRTPGNLAEDLEDHLSHRADELFSAAVSFCHNGGEGASWMQWRTIVHAIRLAERIAPKGALRWRPTGTWPALGIGLGLTAVLAVAILPGWRESLLYSLAQGDGQTGWARSPCYGSTRLPSMPHLGNTCPSGFTAIRPAAAANCTCTTMTANAKPSPCSRRMAS
jgi:hypothetical protein